MLGMVNGHLTITAWDPKTHRNGQVELRFDNYPLDQATMEFQNGLLLTIIAESTSVLPEEKD